MDGRLRTIEFFDWLVLSKKLALLALYIRDDSLLIHRKVKAPRKFPGRFYLLYVSVRFPSWESVSGHPVAVARVLSKIIWIGIPLSSLVDQRST